jgi:sigma-E factor negative regulatory protein RseA
MHETAVRLEAAMTNFEHDFLTQQEQWSALHDGQLAGVDARALVRASLTDERLMQQWRSMSAIGQVMRAQAHQPTLPRSLPAQTAASQSTPVQNAPVQNAPGIDTRASANDGRWRMLAGLATLAAVGALVWGLLGGAGGSWVGQDQILASSPAGAAKASVTLVNTNNGLSRVQIAGQEATMIRNPRLDEFLAAHKQFGGVSALQQPAGSLRSVSVSVSQP